MKDFLSRLWWWFFAIAFIISFLLAFPGFFILLLRPRWYAAAHAYRRFCCRIFLWLMFIKIDIRGLERVDWAKTLILCSNHFSEVDILVTIAVVPTYFSFLAKKELARIPLFKTFFSTLDIPVDRNNPASAGKVYEMSQEKLEQGISLLIFPEGGIYGEIPKLKRFKKGAFEMSIENNIPIVPFSMPDNWKIFDGESKTGAPGETRIIFHELVYPENHTMNSLKNKIYNIIKKDVEES